MRMLVSALLAAGLSVVAPTAVPTPAAGAQAPAPAAAGAYVALGDSFTAGPLIPNQVEPLGCLRSDRNYPHRVAAALAPAAFRDVSCSGADTGDMTAPQNVTPGPNPPQLDALDAGTSLVTLGIGGNDIGFSGIIEACLTLLPWATPCQDTFVVGGRDELSARIAATAPKVADTLARIRARAPQARVLVVGYPAILPDRGSGCWPSLAIGWDDVDYLRRTTRSLNAMLAAEAARAGAGYVDTYTPSIGHDACTLPGQRWVEPLLPLAPAAPVHPNALGMQGMATAVLSAP